MGRIASELADVAVFTTDNPRSEDPARIAEEMLAGVSSRERVLVVLDRKQAMERACAAARAGDLVLTCGKGAETYQEIAGVKHPFPEREILREAARAADASRGAAPE
jgi:UDP-N-acetylmuramoyl-L-alanyl-D-glutamate--2,6-diaminopimelate ligase